MTATSELGITKRASNGTRLEREGLADFDRTSFGGAGVWVREGRPKVVYCRQGYLCVQPGAARTT
jgi:hypothetical protein